MTLSELLAPYGESKRGYHNYQHILSMLAHLEDYRLVAQHVDLLQLAILFHDVVYDTTQPSGRNETDSAEAALDYMAREGYSTGEQNYVFDLIMATTHKSPGTNVDAKLMQDFDLLSFALAPDFKVTAFGIWKEYSHVRADEFWPNRITVLRWFLDRPRLYHTEQIWERYEERARANILSEIHWIQTMGY